MIRLEEKGGNPEGNPGRKRGWEEEQLSLEEIEGKKGSFVLSLEFAKFYKSSREFPSLRVREFGRERERSREFSSFLPPNFHF